VHPANTIQLVDELIKANKDFDLVIGPNRSHGLNEPYFIRRRWDYFVRYLMGASRQEYELRQHQQRQALLRRLTMAVAISGLRARGLYR
jgi:hypothetical protein